ncbi:Uncharacterised protein [BD1-7 clade bacterium]|uniref:N-acetyltransferase domain-containing protein n=1 Tax=BD1-7 clade bacterium TaxID=2029982 RepID=A0A5S9Q4A0_9GAMM|nr:Uncharacterised protein [BD1-7 clade bacterium]CAA0111951.1 Uncharacterised protein [BD1-7 clade bacterium]
MSIRPATNSDIPELSHLHVQCWRHTYGDLLGKSQLERVTEQASARFLESELQDTGAMTYVVTEHSAARSPILGFACVSPAREELPECCGEIKSCYVHPDWKHTGLGHRLFSHATYRLQSVGYANAVLWVFEENVPARCFFAAEGFLRRGDSHYIDSFGVNEVCYQRDLTCL